MSLSSTFRLAQLSDCGKELGIRTAHFPKIHHVSNKERKLNREKLYDRLNSARHIIMGVFHLQNIK